MKGLPAMLLPTGKWQKRLRTAAKVVAIIAAAVALVGSALRLMAPKPCSQVAQCVAHDRLAPRSYHYFMAVALFVLFLREASGLFAQFIQVRQNRLLSVWSLKDQCLPGLLLCVIIFVLALTMLVYASSDSPWATSASASYAHRPVHSLRYFEWLATVPLMLMLAGCCALGRRLSEVAVPVAVTEAYITVSWAALHAENTQLCWLLLIATFTGYSWASRDMLRWVTAFLEAAPPGLTCRRLRAFASVFLVVLFAFYGMVYLLVFANAISSHAEQVAYTSAGFASKVLMSLLFTAIRAMEYHQTLGDLLCRVKGVSTAFMSLLRGSFDVVMPCVAAATGECFLPDFYSSDLAELERSLGRTILGSSLNEQLADAQDRETFAAYVQNVQRQANSALNPRQPDLGFPAKLPGLGDGMLPPVSQVLHVKLHRTSDASCERRVGRVGNRNRDVINTIIHLTAVPRAGAPPDSPKQMIVGLRLDPHDAEPPSPPPEWSTDTSASPMSGMEDTQETPSTSAQSASHENMLYSISGCPSDETSARDLEVKRGVRTARLMVKLLHRRMNRATARRHKPWQGPSKRRSLKGQPRGCVAGDKLAERSACSSSSARGTDAQHPFGGSDVCSQSSKLSYIGSVTMACRQLLGPLHDKLPPKPFVSKRIEDHMQCAAEMVRLLPPVKIAKFKYEQEMAAWRSTAQNHSVSSMLSQSHAPETGIAEDVWYSSVLPHLQEPPPSRRPRAPLLPDDDEIWLKAWRRTYEESESEETSEVEPSDESD